MIYEKYSLPVTAGFEDGRESRDKEYRQLSETGKGKIFQKETHGSQYIDNSLGRPISDF